jgi:lipopolysaccharide/colanic/teichoic acid biosynthesis glycosyltransferase
MDMITAAFGLVFLSPVLFVIASAIVITSGKPIFFRQWRLGKFGQRFQLLKFRTMTARAAEKGPGLTQDGDARVTGIGRRLRKWKLDELPQLLNVLKGDMTLVGPRPDLEQFWSKATDTDRRILALTPGLTGAASIAFRNEERLLGKVPEEFLTSFYLQQVLPQKARLDIEYAAQATLRSDYGILLRTLLVSLPQQHPVEKKSDAQVSEE